MQKHITSVTDVKHQVFFIEYVEMDKGDVPIWKEYFQIWYMQGTPYALYDNYAYVTL